MILLIDNYDSFTRNLYQYFCELGAEVVVRRNDEIALDDIDALAPQKIVISPGPCTPSESGISLAVIQHYAGKLPILGVCTGHQEPLRRSLAPPLSVPRKSCMAKPHRSHTPVPAHSRG